MLFVLDHTHLPASFQLWIFPYITEKYLDVIMTGSYTWVKLCYTYNAIRITFWRLPYPTKESPMKPTLFDLSSLCSHASTLCISAPVTWLDTPIHTASPGGKSDTKVDTIAGEYSCTNLHISVVLIATEASTVVCHSSWQAGRRFRGKGKSACHTLLARNMLYLRHASYLELDEEALHGAEAACSLR
jgi:hypothetical protein